MKSKKEVAQFLVTPSQSWLLISALGLLNYGLVEARHARDMISVNSFVKSHGVGQSQVAMG